MAEYLGACSEDEVISNSKIKNLTGFSPSDSLLLFSTHLFIPVSPLCHSHPPSVIPAQAGIQIQLDPQSEALRFRLRMTRGVSFPYLPFVIPVKTGIQIQLDPQSEALRFRLRMTGGAGSRIKCGMTKRNVDPQSEVLGFRLRMTRGVSFP